MKLKPYCSEIIKTAFSNKVVFTLLSVTSLLIAAGIYITAGAANAAYDTLRLQTESAEGRFIRFSNLDFSAYKQADALNYLSSFSTNETVLVSAETIDLINPYTGLDSPPIAFKRVSSSKPIYKLIAGRLPTDNSELMVGKELATQMRMETPQGYLITSDGFHNYSIVGIYEAEKPFDFLNRVSLGKTNPTDPVVFVDIVADKMESIPSVITTVYDMQTSPKEDFNAETSPYYTKFVKQSLKKIRLYSERAVLGATVLGILVSLGVSLASAMLNRADYGRRRALGASSYFLFALVIGQSILSSALGGIIGLGAVSAIFISKGVVVNITYGIYIFLMSMAVQVLAALIPAIIVVNQDPVRVLRTP